MASGASTKSCQDKLIKFSRRFPGKLAAATLQKWDNKLKAGSDLPIFKYDDTPPCASMFMKLVVRPELGPKVNPRNVREMEVVANTIDLLAQGRVGEAADALTQRMIALRMAIDDDSWSKAAFVELTPYDPSSMVPRPMRSMALKEADDYRKLQVSDTSGNASIEPRQELPTNDPHPQVWSGRPKKFGKGGKGGKGNKNKSWWNQDKSGKKARGWR